MLKLSLRADLMICGMASFPFITRTSSLPRKENSVYDTTPVHSQRKPSVWLCRPRARWRLACFYATLGTVCTENLIRFDCLPESQRKVRGRVHLTNSDRLFFMQLYRWFLSVLKAITIIRLQTFVRWHRAGFRRYWRWKSRSLGGRPQIDADLRALIRRTSVENLLWGAPRIHGELLKLGFAGAQSTVANGMDRPCSRPQRHAESVGGF